MGPIFKLILGQMTHVSFGSVGSTANAYIQKEQCYWHGICQASLDGSSAANHNNNHHHYDNNNRDETTTEGTTLHVYAHSAQNKLKQEAT